MSLIKDTIKEGYEQKVIEILEKKQYCICCSGYPKSAEVWEPKICLLKDLPVNEIRTEVGKCDFYDEERKLLE